MFFYFIKKYKESVSMSDVFGVNDGHTVSGPGSGAVGRIKDGEHTRLVGNEVRRLLKERGNTVYNCTIDYASTTNESLALIIQQANRQELDWFISIHFNAGGGKGVEVYTYEGRQYQDAIDVCKNISNLGFINRGVKAGTGLYVIRKTKAKSMLIEVCFVDTDDANKYLEVGYKAIAKAIVDALDKHISNNSNNNDNEEEKKVKGIVIYSNDVDRRAAEYLADYLKLPTISSKTNFDYTTVEQSGVYAVGGDKGTYTSYLKDENFIAGSDRYETIKAVLKRIGKL